MFTRSRKTLVAPAFSGVNIVVNVETQRSHVHPRRSR